MATRVIHRPARTHVDPLPRKVLEVAAPPTLDAPTESQSGGVLQLAMPLVAGGGMVLMMISVGNPIRMIAGLAFVVIAVMLGLSMYVRSKTGHRKRAEQSRESFIRFLQRLRTNIADEIDLQRTVQLRLHPAPEALLYLIADPARVYERRRTDRDFGVVRIGTGAGPLAREVKYAPVMNAAAEVDEISAAHLERATMMLERIDGIPVTVPLEGVVSIVGSAERCREVVRAALIQLMVLHAPEDAVIHVCSGSDASHYNWLKLAPHFLDMDTFDGPIHARRFTIDQNNLAAVLGPVIARRIDAKTTPTPFIVVIIDLDDAAGQTPLALFPPGVTPQDVGICVVTHCRRRISEPSEVSRRVVVTEEGQVTVEDPNPVDEGPSLQNKETRADRLIRGATNGSLDAVDLILSQAVVRELAPLRLAPESAAAAPLDTEVSIEKLLRIEDVGTIEPASMWRPRPVGDFLKVPFGIDAVGNPVYLDLKESALGGHGPHGLCVGATGSGKSEVLRTLVLSLALTHSPERLAFVLVDYKGGAAFAGLDILPHTSAMVDNLGDEDGLVDRLHDALSGEMQQRQRVLLDAGVKNIYDYNDRRDAGAPLDPLPHLAVIIDEFGEILVQKPDFLDLFVQIGRIGRSIGVHLLLASQRLEEGRLRGLESHLSYRLGLRTFSAAESKAVIGTNDAHELPALPGSGYLKVDPDVYTRFKAAYVSGRYVPATGRPSDDVKITPVPMMLRNTSAEWITQQAEFAKAKLGVEHTKAEVDPFDQITLEVVAERLAAAGEPVTQIWLPPLPSTLRIPEWLDTVSEATTVSDVAALSFPIGLVDDPARQWQGVLTLDTATSHVMVIGAPQTGKTTTARAIVVGSALTHSPEQIGWYVVDAAGTSLADLEQLPHVGGVATRFDPDRIRRAVAETAYELSVREELFARHRIASLDQFRGLVADGTLAQAGPPDRYLLIDGWSSFASDFEFLVEPITDIIVRGLSFGIHVIIVANRIGDMRMNLHTNIGTTVEHRLPQPIDSMLSRALQERIGTKQPGRVITPDTTLAQIVNAAGKETAQLLEIVARTWPDSAVPPIRMLPDRITYNELLTQCAEHTPVVVGVDETTLSPVNLGLFDDDRHVLIVGDGASGKTTTLRTILGDLVTHLDPDNLTVLIIDPRRSLLDFVPQPPRQGYTITTEQSADMLARLSDFLRQRLPGPDVTPQQLRDRSWWEGADVVVVVDDYDVLVPTSTSQNPLTHLVPLLPHARDIGLHLVIARKAGGISRALFDPVISTLRDSGAAAILLSGDRSEGQIYDRIYLQPEPPGRGRLIRRNTTPVRTQFADWPDSESPTATTTTGA